MKPPGVTWVVGSRGLLGQHVSVLLPDRMDPPEIPWPDPKGANDALRQGIRTLLDLAGSGPWNIAWCAGAGVVATSAEAIDEERAVFATFLADLADATRGRASGAVFFASSAGGVFADSTSPPFNEASAPRPRSAYGRAKLSMEADLRSFAATTGTPVLIGRIANLYGPGQNLGKAQGLVSQICRTHLTGKSLSLYVPLDTMRDYLYVKDCAEMVVAGLAGLRSRTDLAVTKIMASGTSTTIGGLLGEAARLFRRRPRVVLGTSPASSGQVHDLRMRSTVWGELDRCARTPLPIGIAATAEDVGQRLRAPDQAEGRPSAR